MAELLELSDERDRWERYALDLARAGYAAGYADGDRGGYARGARLLEESWPAVVQPVLRDRPDHAEVEARRWGPGGREHFGDPRPGDRFPREAA